MKKNKSENIVCFINQVVIYIAMIGNHSFNTESFRVFIGEVLAKKYGDLNDLSKVINIDKILNDHWKLYENTKNNYSYDQTEGVNFSVDAFNEKFKIVESTIENVISEYEKTIEYFISCRENYNQESIIDNSIDESIEIFLKMIRAKIVISNCLISGNVDENEIKFFQMENFSQKNINYINNFLLRSKKIVKKLEKKNKLYNKENINYFLETKKIIGELNRTLNKIFRMYKRINSYLKFIGEHHEWKDTKFYDSNKYSIVITINSLYENTIQIKNVLDESSSYFHNLNEDIKNIVVCNTIKNIANKDVEDIIHKKIMEFYRVDHIAFHKRAIENMEILRGKNLEKIEILNGLDSLHERAFILADDIISSIKMAQSQMVKHSELTDLQLKSKYVDYFPSEKLSILNKFKLKYNEMFNAFDKSIEIIKSKYAVDSNGKAMSRMAFLKHGLMNHLEEVERTQKNIFGVIDTSNFSYGDNSEIMKMLAVAYQSMSVDDYKDLITELSKENEFDNLMSMDLESCKSLISKIDELIEQCDQKISDSTGFNISDYLPLTPEDLATLASNIQKKLN